MSKNDHHSLHNLDQSNSISRPSYSQISLCKPQPSVNWISTSEHHCHRYWRGSRRCSAEMSANGANKSRRFVVTSIWKFKYLTEQISGHPGENVLCPEILRLTAERQSSSSFWRETINFCLSKDTSSHYRYSGRQIKFQHEGNSLFLPRSIWWHCIKHWLPAICSYDINLGWTLSS